MTSTESDKCFDAAKKGREHEVRRVTDPFPPPSLQSVSGAVVFSVFEIRVDANYSAVVMCAVQSCAMRTMRLQNVFSTVRSGCSTV